MLAIQLVARTFDACSVIENDVYTIWYRGRRKQKGLKTQ
jgi:hypothetical protein